MTRDRNNLSLLIPLREKIVGLIWGWYKQLQTCLCKCYTGTGFPKIENFVEMGTDLLSRCSQYDIPWIFPWKWHRKEFQAPFSTKNSQHSPALQREDVQGPKRHKKKPAWNQKPALKKNYELLEWVHLLAPKRKFISLGKATQVPKDMKIIYRLLAFEQKVFYDIFLFPHLSHRGNGATADIYGH